MPALGHPDTCILCRHVGHPSAGRRPHGPIDVTVPSGDGGSGGGIGKLDGLDTTMQPDEVEDSEFLVREEEFLDLHRPTCRVDTSVSDIIRGGLIHFRVGMEDLRDLYAYRSDCPSTVASL